mgnify:FL=1
MEMNEIAQLYTYLKNASNIARTRPEYERVWDLVEDALYELDMMVSSTEEVK